MDKNLKRLKEAWFSAGERYFSELRRIYPIGAAISWEARGAIQTGKVTDHCYQDGLRVLNEATGKEYDIHSYWIRP